MKNCPFYWHPAKVRIQFWIFVTVCWVFDAFLSGKITLQCYFLRKCFWTCFSIWESHWTWLCLGTGSHKAVFSQLWNTPPLWKNLVYFHDTSQFFQSIRIYYRIFDFSPALTPYSYTLLLPLSLELESAYNSATLEIGGKIVKLISAIYLIPSPKGGKFFFLNLESTEGWEIFLEVSKKAAILVITYKSP